jgi:hypothetical protein
MARHQVDGSAQRRYKTGSASLHYLSVPNSTQQHKPLQPRKQANKQTTLPASHINHPSISSKTFNSTHLKSWLLTWSLELPEASV